MAHFEYITMVISFVTAFAVSQILAGWSRQYFHRETQAPYALHTVATVLFLATLVQSIWGSWSLREVPWTFGSFLLYFTTTLPLAGAATLIHPPAATAAETPLRDHYFSSGRAAYVMMAVWIVFTGVLEWWLVDYVPVAPDEIAVTTGVRVGSVVTLVWLARSERPSHHWVGLGFLAVLLVTIAIRFANVGAA